MIGQPGRSKGPGGSHQTEKDEDAAVAFPTRLLDWDCWQSSVQADSLVLGTPFSLWDEAVASMLETSNGLAGCMTWLDLRRM